MASDSDEPAVAADRLEAALERIAQAAASRDPPLQHDPQPAMDTVEIAARIDGLIDRLREALGTTAE
jgi:hypothetical protein